MSGRTLDQSKREIEAASPTSLDAAERLLTAFPLPHRTLPAYLHHQAERYGSRELFRCRAEIITYEQAPAVAACWGGLLADEGVSEGDRVAIICGNRPDFIKLFLGCGWLGAIAVPINTASRGLQLQHMLENCGAKLCFVESEVLPALEGLELGSTALEKLRVFDLVGTSTMQEVQVSSVTQPVKPIPAAQLDPGDPLAILYTSGTTGLSKGVLCPHAQFFWWAILTARQLGICSGDVLHTTLPLFHVNALGCFYQALLYGATQVVAPRFSVSRFWSELSQSGATVTYLLGAMVPMLLSKSASASEADHNVRVALAPGVPGHFHREFMDRCGIMLFDGYGSTETNAVIGVDLDSYRQGTMGLIKNDVEAIVADENDEAVPDGTPGQLLLRSSEPFSFCSGYFNMPEATLAAWRNLWFHTGDQVVRSADGQFKFIDRLKDSIRRRGENISSFEVEQVLASHPAVSVCAVFAVQSELGEDEVMAVISLNEDECVSHEELIRFCEGRMSYFSVPRFIDMVDDMPRTESGKVQKYKLREKGRTEGTWDREKAGIVVKR